jgi:hypothetical protein
MNPETVVTVAWVLVIVVAAVLAAREAKKSREERGPAPQPPTDEDVADGKALYQRWLEWLEKQKRG